MDISQHIRKTASIEQKPTLRYTRSGNIRYDASGGLHFPVSKALASIFVVDIFMVDELDQRTHKGNKITMIPSRLRFGLLLTVMVVGEHSDCL